MKSKLDAPDDGSSCPERARSSAVERRLHTPDAVGSIPTAPTTFWSRVDIRGPDDCWQWTGKPSDRGYGRLRFGGKETTAHRVAYSLTAGDISKNMCVRHKCDNRLCCNPAHLEIGTVADNNRDCRERGRHVAPTGPKNGKTKLTPEQIMAIRVDNRTGREIAVAYGISEGNVSMIRGNMRWKWLKEDAA